VGRAARDGELVPAVAATPKVKLGFRVSWVGFITDGLEEGGGDRWRVDGEAAVVAPPQPRATGGVGEKGWRRCEVDRRWGGGVTHSA
jgi:hypothetical protein